MKRTKAFVAGAGLLQRHVVLDHDDDVGLLLQIVDESLWEERHSRIRTSVLQFDNRRPAAAFILRRELVAGNERMFFEKGGNGAAQLPGTVAVNDSDRMLIRDRRFVENFFETGDR